MQKKYKGTQNIECEQQLDWITCALIIETWHLMPIIVTQLGVHVIVRSSRPLRINVCAITLLSENENILFAVSKGPSGILITIPSLPQQLMLLGTILDSSISPTEVDPTLLLCEGSGRDKSKALYQEIANCDFEVSSSVYM